MSYEFLTEDLIIEKLVDHLVKQGFKIEQVCKSTQKGVDIIAVDPKGIRHYIEAKGETSNQKTSKRYGEPFSGNQIWSHVGVSLLKTLTDIHKYGKQNVFG